jgi:hypothetical protein
MDLTGAGTGIMLAIAALLWFVYLVPTWVRRREYLATERTATRLQQTMRIMAETAEMPEAVRVAVTAREAARAERLLRAQQRRADAMVARQVRAEKAAAPMVARVPRTATAGDALKRRRMRRTRLYASILMIGATVLALVQIWLMATTGTTWGSWLVLVGTLTAGGVAIGVQRRLDVLTMPRRPVASEAPVRARIPAPVLDRGAGRPEAPAPWTPTPLPKPLYLSKPAPAPERVLPAAAQTAQPAGPARPEVPLVAAQGRPAAAVTPLRQEPALPRRSGFAAMGIIDPADTAAPDLDEVLRRRRSVG